METIITGIAASAGISIGPAFRLENPELVIEKREVTDLDQEILRLQTALDKAKVELQSIRQHAEQQFSGDEAAIFQAHLLVLDDPEFVGSITGKIETDRVNAEFAVEDTSNTFVALFESMDNPYMRERAADIRDVTKRILSHLLGVHSQSPHMIQEEVIVIANDLTPSDTVQLNPQFVKGFITNIGGPTSHSAILARTLEIPAVVGTQHAMETISNGASIIVDGNNGKVIIHPTPETLTNYKEQQKAHEQQKAEWSQLVNEPTITADGRQVKLGGNIGKPSDAVNVLEYGGESIGLFRTEFLYMGRDQFPTEEEQAIAYQSVLERMGDKETVVRTLDIGGDKELPYLELPNEQNPFLGLRAIRLCLEQEELFRVQLRALLRASIHGQLKIMFPMITTVEEFRRAKAIFKEEQAALQERQVPVSDSIELGMMVETPAAAIMADAFAKEVDFFSIGTNDLIQYTMAADRMNERVSYLYQPYNPAILRLIKMVIDAAHREGKQVGMCGEMAGDKFAVPLLLGMGLDEFSMSASSILQVRSQIAQLNQAELAEQIDSVLSLSSAEEVLAWTRSQTEKHGRP